MKHLCLMLIETVLRQKCLKVVSSETYLRRVFVYKKGFDENKRKIGIWLVSLKGLCLGHRGDGKKLRGSYQVTWQL